MEERRLRELLPDVKVVPSNVFLSGYSGELTPVQGCAEILVKYNDREVLPLFVVGGTSPTLLGRNWIQALGLPVADVVNLHNTSTEGLFSKFPEVFSGGPGLLKNVEAKMCVPDGSRPRFFKPRPVPFFIARSGHSRASTTGTGRNFEASWDF